MNNNNQPRSYINYLQNKIVELTHQYYHAIKSNITFENIKVIFLKRKELQDELSDLKEKESNDDNSEDQNIDTSLSVQ